MSLVLDVVFAIPWSMKKLAMVKTMSNATARDKNLFTASPWF
jgi:hypothetical protein